MEKHVCDFYIVWRSGGPEWTCDCLRTLTLMEMTARLNATERLSAEDIDLILFVMAENSIAFNASPERQRIAKALRAYANILEGK